MPSLQHDCLRRVLVVEDVVDCLETMVDLICTQHCEVRAARDGKTAVAVAKEFLPHVVLLDLGLPIMDGNEAAAQMRLDPRLQYTIIVVISGYGMAADKIRSAQAGADLHLVKPVAFADVARLLSLHGGPRQE